MSESLDLHRFIKAQDPVYDEALAELRAGRKEGHWMWFIFPQLKGLGHSWMATRYGISSRSEAEAYLAHPTLRSRLEECTRAVLHVKGRPIEEIFGSIDAMKFRSSMTLFAAVSAGDSPYMEALHKYFDGKPDPLTMQRV